jgi:excisionase family DNA binding protein
MIEYILLLFRTMSSQDLYSIEQVAALLDLHVRTVRSYVRTGRLKGVRIGKQYRIAAEDLEAFTGRPVTTANPVRRQRHVEVSSIVQIDAISPESAGHVSNMLMAASAGDRSGDAALRIDTVYNEELGRLKAILTGSISTIVPLLKLIDALAESRP